VLLATSIAAGRRIGRAAYWMGAMMLRRAVMMALVGLSEVAYREPKRYR